MSPNLVCIVIGLIATSAVAQQVSFKLAPSKDALSYTVVSKSEMTTVTKRTIDGEERGGRGGGGRTTKSTQKLVFREGPAKSNWRQYITAEATVTRPTRAGEDTTSKIIGAVAGKKIFMVKEGKRTVFKADSVDGEALPRQAIAGIPAQLNLGGLLPAKPLEVAGKSKLKKGFAKTLRRLLHPVTKKREPRSEGDGANNRGRGAQRAGNAATWNTSVIRTLNSKKLTTDGTAQLVSVSEEGGKTLAVLAIDGVIHGEGTPTELGMGAARRRRGQPDGDQKEDTGTASFTMKITGQIVVDQTNQRVHSVSLKGDVQSSSVSSRTTNRNDQQRKIDTAKSTAGSFSVDLSCETIATSPKEATPAETAKKRLPKSASR